MDQNSDSPSTTIRRPLSGHTGPDTAYVVEDYPYGGLRTSIRYWLEHKPNYGHRMVSQTKNPKTGRWNSPKPSIYTPFAASMYLDGDSYVQWTGVGPYTSAADTLRFVTDFPGAVTPLLKVWAAEKVELYRHLLEENTQGRSGWSVNGVPQPTTEEDTRRNTAELETWKAVLNLIQ